MLPFTRRLAELAVLGVRIATLTLFGHATLSRVDFGTAHPLWSTFDIGATAKLSGNKRITGELQREDRGADQNVLLTSRLDFRLSGKSDAYVGGAASFGAPFREDWSASAGISQRVGKGLWLTLDTRYARYQSSFPGKSGQTVGLVKIAPGVVIVPTGLPVEFSAQMINLRNELGRIEHGWSARGSYYFGDRNFLFAGASQYPETERGVTRRMTSVYAGVRHDLTPRLGFRLTFERSRLESSYVRRGVTFGLELKL